MNAVKIGRPTALAEIANPSTMLNASRLARARRTLGEIAAVASDDLAPLSVAAREIRSMIR